MVPDNEGLNRQGNLNDMWWMFEAVAISWGRDYLVQTSPVVTRGWFSLWLLASF